MIIDEFEATTAGQKVVVVRPYMGADVESARFGLDEARGLAQAIGLDVAASELVRLRVLRPGTYLGKGKIEELAATVRATGASLLFLDCALSPIQQSNLETACDTKVIDRTGLILEIFGRRAETSEGRMQVELAHLEYQRGRLVRSWTHLERQRGGFGFMGGPGERQIESDRRLIRERIARIRKELEKVVKTRALHRKSRAKVAYPVVALVGYTNAGKSTLFNRLTAANVVADKRLFATLDPTLRGLTLPSGRKIILSDTVGFIAELPTELVAAFRATLEEVVGAEVLVHVEDAGAPDARLRRSEVEKVLDSLGIDRDASPVIRAANKIDLFDADRCRELTIRAERNPLFAAISSTTGQGVDGLLAAIDNALDEGETKMTLKLRHDQAKLISWIYENATVLSREEHDDGPELSIRISPKIEGQLRRRLGDNIIL